MRLFEDELHEWFATWALGFAPYGGSDVGEVTAIAASVEPGDDGSYYDAWSGFADRLADRARQDEQKGRRRSARESYLHAACYYAVAYHPLFGSPVDPRLTKAFHGQMEAFDRAMELSDPPVERVDVPFEGTTLPAYLIRAAGRETERRPLVIAGTGYDATVTETYFGTAAAAAARGYHCLFHDGPGQGQLLFEEGIPIRPDWENVVRPVMDVALQREEVDPERIAYSSWSLGGYLAPRAASGEHRLAACIADPGVWNVLDSFRASALAMGVPKDQAEAFPEIDDRLVEVFTMAIQANRGLRWRVVSRGFWVGGVDNLRHYLRSIAEFTMQDRAKEIRCPTLLTQAEDDPLARGAPTLLEHLTCPKQLEVFTAAEGAGEHCEILNRSLANRRIYDWLDGVLGA